MEPLSILRVSPASPSSSELETIVINKGDPSQSPLLESSRSWVSSLLSLPPSLVPLLPRNKSVPAVATETADANMHCLAYWIFKGAPLSPHHVLQPQGLSRPCLLVPTKADLSERTGSFPGALRIFLLAASGLAGGRSELFLGREWRRQGVRGLPCSGPSGVSSRRG